MCECVGGANENVCLFKNLIFLTKAFLQAEECGNDIRREFVRKSAEV